MKLHIDVNTSSLFVAVAELFCTLPQRHLSSFQQTLLGHLKASVLGLERGRVGEPVQGSFRGRTVRSSALKNLKNAPRSSVPAGGNTNAEVIRNPLDEGEFLVESI